VNFPEAMPAEHFDELIKKNKIKCPKCKGELGEVKRFNMMLEVQVGATGKQKGYLRPETCQNIFLDYDRLSKTMRLNLPFGVAQAGKSFRNEIAPRNMLLREREINQMEIEVFFNPKKINEVKKFGEIENKKLNIQKLKEEKPKEITAKELVDKNIVSGKLIAYYLARVQELYEFYGAPKEKMKFRQLGEEEKAILRPQNIKSILVVPLFVNANYYGFIGFDECRNCRHPEVQGAGGGLATAFRLFRLPLDQRKR
jgi:glycyl-tRNA synthetase